MLPLHSPSISPWLSRWEWNLKGRDTVSNLLCSHPPSGPPRVLFYWHHCIETWQANLKPPPPTFYHSPLLASCPGDVTRHMVFSSIKPEKRFSQRREKVSEGVGLERRAGQRRKTKAQLFLLRVEGGEDSGKGGGRLHCVRRMRRERAAASAMCCTDADWAGPRTKTFAQSLKRS